MRRSTKMGVVAAAAASVVWACAGDSMEGLADAMIEGGDAMVEGGTALRDATTNDAAAQEVVEVTCTEQTTFAIRRNDGSYDYDRTWWVAEVRRADIDPARVVGVDAVLCGREDFAPREVCPAESTCTGDPASPLDCTVQSGAEIEPGLVRVPCGFRISQVIRGTTTTTNVAGTRWTTARITIR